MASLCLYLQAHQPLRLRRFSVFDIGAGKPYFDDERNHFYLERIVNKCYRPTTELLLELVRRHRGRFAVNFGLTGALLEQLEAQFPDVIKNFQALVGTGHVEIMGETYHHSLAFFYSRPEFNAQVEAHRRKIWELFKVRPKVFRNTELATTNALAAAVKKMGYKALLAEGHDWLLGWRSPNFLYSLKTARGLPVLLRNYRLSDDISFRFSAQWWSGWPLTADRFAAWVDEAGRESHTVNLFMDLETFGEHQWPETGIFDFLSHLPEHIFKNEKSVFRTVSKVAALHKPVGEIDMHHLTSWADVERDLSAWRGNKMQQTALAELYALEKRVKRSHDPKILRDWRFLQTSDHFYYMCTKWFSDGDVHKYFNPYESPYEAYLTFVNILNDLRFRLESKRRRTR